MHEFYFENLTSESPGDPDSGSPFYQATQQSFGIFELWKTDFTNVAKMRGVGWAICYRDPTNGKLSNHWISLHENGNIAGFSPLLVLDVWEHAFMLDYTASGRGKYVEAFFSNVYWNVIENRLRVMENNYAGSTGR